MNKQIRNYLTISILCVGLTVVAGQAIAESSWQTQRLLAPSESQLKTERQGRVVIYDGMHETLVDRALDTQFGRVESMMFVGVRHTDPDGGEWADDDCD